MGHGGITGGPQEKIELFFLNNIELSMLHKYRLHTDAATSVRWLINICTHCLLLHRLYITVLKNSLVKCKTG